MRIPRKRRRRRSFLPGRPWLAVRGLIAVVAAGAIAAVLVGRATGSLDPTGDVFVGVPVSAGLISTAAPVRYHGVNVGRIAEIESGTQTSRVRLAIDRDSLPLIPDTVVARIVPRTFFGDIYLQLADDPGGRTGKPLGTGATISIDDSDDAMALYDVFTKIVDVFSTIKPEKMQTALTAISQALRHRGTEIGFTIDNLRDVSALLTPTVVQFLDTTPQFRDVMAALHTATPDILTTLSAATNVSNRLADDSAAFGSALSEMAGLGSLLTGFFADHRDQFITVLDAAGKVLATTAAHPEGLVETLVGARDFGAAGSKVFATGKFSITAVATFAGPMPYTAADCPVYGTSYGAHCAEADPFNPVPTMPLEVPLPDSVDLKTPAPVVFLPEGQPSGGAAPPPPGPAPHFPAEAAPAAAIAGGAAEAHALGVLQNEVLGRGARDGTPEPNIATVMMLGPLVRGTAVQVS
ncbi:MCE family protein [[Mycobacterium] burgundiense]|uniref:MCE family protein n=1 Tax=[Mycobacterium] burgundiense TaxID=3064286 RepID=A0ABM9M1L7_9MYCO|nr:MCE family protein [Mycolicibacterium sp. MU0053]CAJ1508637.1 MCE family protein [Mycolicibacterium sp. MU0053]